MSADQGLARALRNSAWRDILYYTPEVSRAAFILPPCFAVQGGEDKLLQSGSLARDRGPQQAI